MQVATSTSAEFLFYKQDTVLLLLLAKLIPRYLALLESLAMDFVGAVNNIALLVMRMTSHLSGLNFISQSSSHFCSWSKSSCNSVASSSDEIVQYMRQSLANRRVVELTIPGRSLMYTRNSNDPRTVPCGTPDVTSDVEDVFPSRTTCWALSKRKLFTH